MTDLWGTDLGLAELAFPLAALLVVFFGVVPLLTVASRAVLRRARQTRSWAGFGSQSTFALLVAPTLLPLAWLTSATLHQNEWAQLSNGCLVPHVGEACADAMLLLTGLLGTLAVATGLRAWRERPRMPVRAMARANPIAARVHRIVAADPRLRRLSVIVAQNSADPVCTLGWFRPRVIVDACFAEAADDAMLRAALLHERAHVAGFDTVRDFLVRFSLAFNPAGRWLAPDFERWRHAREAQCDSVAVHDGGEPLALAESILCAARFECRGHAQPGVARLGVAHLCGHDATVLKLRLALLVQGPPAPIRGRAQLVLAVALLSVIVAPHLSSAGLLEHFHLAVERLFHT